MADYTGRDPAGQPGTHWLMVFVFLMLAHVASGPMTGRLPVGKTEFPVDILRQNPHITRTQHP